MVVRDPRDVFMSFWNHYSADDRRLFRADERPAPLDRPADAALPRGHPRALGEWINRGWFPWESEGWPHSGNLYHTASWWRFRHLPNIAFVHFADLLADLPGEIAASPPISASTPGGDDRRGGAGGQLRGAAPDMAAAGPMPEEGRPHLERGLDSFFFRGTNGRWREVLTADELAMYDRAKARCLTPDCAAYLEAGRAAWAAPRSASTRAA